jgi:phage baseplate assembly protein W
MAYIVRNNLNGEKRPSVGVGITIPFDGPTGINSSYSTQQAIKSNLLNYLLTDNRERIFNPNFGSGIRGKLFEQLNTSTVDELNNMLINEIDLYFPNVLISQLSITPIADLNTLQIFFRYSVALTNIEDEIQITFADANQ